MNDIPRPGVLVKSTKPDLCPPAPHKNKAGVVSPLKDWLCIEQPCENKMVKYGRCQDHLNKH